MAKLKLRKMATAAILAIATIGLIASTLIPLLFIL